MKKKCLWVGLLALSTTLLVSCSASTPNDVTLTTTPGVCVSSLKSNYEVSASSYYPYNAFPINAYMPASSPYCMAVTITNNNTGENANNVQVYQNGLTLAYTIESTTYTSSMVDYNAAGLSSGNFYNTTTQQLANIALFDPNNCVTTIGANVNTISKNGEQCTFFLQLVSESMPVGDLSLTLNVNYTNGNDNYNVSTNIYEHTVLYAGGTFTEPANYLALYHSGSSAESLGYSLPQNMNAIKLLAKDILGNDYAYDGTNVFQFNGESIILTNGSPANINSFSWDGQGHVFAATTNGLYVYNAASGNSAMWSIVNGESSGYISSVQAFESAPNNVLYIANSNGIESCAFANNTCLPNLVYSASGTVNNGALQANIQESQIAWASGSNVYRNSNLLSLASGSFLESGTIGLDMLNGLYFANAAGTFESAVYYNVFGQSQIQPLLDANNNSLYGRSNGVLLRSYSIASNSLMTLYTYGSIFSNGAYLAYLPLLAGNSYTASGTWTGIAGFNQTVNSTVITSRLANN